MLQFIVLGLVPGTSVQLNFTNYLLILGIFLVISWIIGTTLEWFVRNKMSRMATNLYPYLKFRRQQDSFTVKLHLNN